MNKKAIITEILIWFLVLTVIFSGIFLVYFKFFVKPNTYSIKFKDINGITKGSPVRFMGINIGHVRKLTSIDKSVMVEILITKKDMVIPKGTTARVEFYGLGGSKSIELMPSDTQDADGIVTTDSIRIADVVSKARSFVEIIEIIENFVKSLDKSSVQNILENVEDISPKDIKNFEAELNKSGYEMTVKVKDIKSRQNDMEAAVNRANNLILNINKFIKN